MPQELRWKVDPDVLTFCAEIAAPSTCPADFICPFSTGSAIEVRSTLPLHELHLHPFALCLVAPC